MYIAKESPWWCFVRKYWCKENKSTITLYACLCVVCADRLWYDWLPEWAAGRLSGSVHWHCAGLERRWGAHQPWVHASSLICVVISYVSFHKHENYACLHLCVNAAGKLFASVRDIPGCFHAKLVLIHNFSVRLQACCEEFSFWWLCFVQKMLLFFNHMLHTSFLSWST